MVKVGVCIGPRLRVYRAGLKLGTRLRLGRYRARVKAWVREGLGLRLRLFPMTLMVIMMMPL